MSTAHQSRYTCWMHNDKRAFDTHPGRPVVHFGVGRQVHSLQDLLKQINCHPEDNPFLTDHCCESYRFSSEAFMLTPFNQQSRILRFILESPPENDSDL